MKCELVENQTNCLGHIEDSRKKLFQSADTMASQLEFQNQSLRKLDVPLILDLIEGLYLA